MGRPRAVSSADMARTLDCLTRAGITVGEIIVEPGRIRILPKSLAPLPLRRGLPYPSENNGRGRIVKSAATTGNQGPAGRYVSEMDDVDGSLFRYQR